MTDVSAEEKNNRHMHHNIPYLLNTKEHSVM